VKTLNANWLASLTPSQRTKWLASLSKEELEHLQYDWDFWARENQLAPNGDWNVWLILAGRGFGKTRAGAEWVRSIVCGDTPLARGQYSHIAIVGETAADCRDVLVEGPAGILAIHSPAYRPIYTSSQRRLTWPNGATATLFNATEPDQLRGPQHDAAWADELAKWRYAQETWDMLQFGLRMGDNPKQCITTTPRPIPIIRDMIRASDTDSSIRVTRGSTFDNSANLAPAFITAIKKRYEGTRLGRQELNAEVLDDVPGALWTRESLDKYRVKRPLDGSAPKLPVMQRIVVAIDPAITAPADGASMDETAETGIVVAGLGEDGRGYVLEDLTCRLAPNGWARKAVNGFDYFLADTIVAEINQGGAMVTQVIQSVRPGIPVTTVRASKGKSTRAEPVSALYEQGRISHVGTFSELEDQMVLFTPFGIEGETTADRVDALVWALTTLFPSIVYRVEQDEFEDERRGSHIGRDTHTGY
jgi:predicted phage terminase large subunit-like protein